MFNGKYVKKKALGKVNDITVELGHYVVDGHVYDDKVYVFNHYTKAGKKASQVIAKFSIDDAREIAKILAKV